MQEETEYINVYGARVHNLKNIDAEIPRNSLTVITGLSGSGKSSLAFDTIFAEGQRRYIETFFGIRPQLPGKLGASGRGQDNGTEPGYLHRAENHEQESALHCGHHHRGVRLPASALCPRRRRLLLPLGREDGEVHRRADTGPHSERL